MKRGKRAPEGKELLHLITACQSSTFGLTLLLQCSDEQLLSYTCYRNANSKHCHDGSFIFSRPRESTAHVQYCEKVLKI